MSTEEKLHQLREEWKEARARDDFDFMTSEFSESPIEALFTAALLVGARGRMFVEAFRDATGTLLSEMHDLHLQGAPMALWVTDPESAMGFVVLMQPTLRLPEGRSMRLDYVVLGGNYGYSSVLTGVRIAVELDGHDFHERTKEQAKRDKSRDRRLAVDGWTVLRFTGSEVHADALGCVSELLKVCRSRVQEHS